MATETISEKLDRLSRQGHPTTASIEVTARCNARCEYCYLHDAAFKELSTEQLCAAIGKLSENGVIHLHLTGGEPFLRPDMLTVLAFAAEHGVFACTLFTNGTLLTDGHVDFLVRNRDFFRSIQLSAFSHIPEVNDSYFGIPGALHVILERARYLKKQGLPVTLALSVLDWNVDSLEETRSFFEKYDLAPSLSHFKIITGPRLERVLGQSSTVAFFTRFLRNVRPHELEQFKKEMRNSFAEPAHTNTGLCFGRWNTVFMNAQGDLSPCLTFRNVKFGNILEERPLKNILQESEEYHSICAYRKDHVTKCSSCTFLNFCCVCLGNIHTKYGSYYSADIQTCNFARALYAMTYQREVTA